MPNTFDSFSNGDVIDAHNVYELHGPIQDLERGKAFFAVANVSSSTSTAFVADLEPPPDSTHQEGLFVHLKVPVTNAAGSPDVTLELNGLGAKPIFKGDGQSLAAGDLLADQMVALVYDPAAGSGGAFLLLSASSAGGSGPITWSDLPFDQPTGNTILGSSSLASNTGDYSTAVGFEALRDNTTGYWNTATGAYVLSHNTTGLSNVAVGTYALQLNTDGSDNVAIGVQAGNSNDSGSSNIAIGSYSLASNTDSGANIAIGREALYNSTAADNTAIGYIAMRDTVDGSSNVGVGYGALTGNVSGSFNSAVGREAMFSNTGAQNTGMGYTALANNQGDYNCAFGSNCLAQNTTGYSNSAMGASALAVNTTGYENCAIGIGALASNTGGVRNIAIGTSAAGANDVGSDNVAIGRYALVSNTSGNNNTTLGYYAGSSLTVGSGNIAIGANIEVADPAEDNQINLGNCLMRNGPRQSVSLRAGSLAYANSSDTAILDLTALRGWVGFTDDANGWCRLRVNPSSIAIEASSADWVASASPASGEVGLYVSSGALHMVLGSAAARVIGFTDQTMAY